MTALPIVLAPVILPFVWQTAYGLDLLNVYLSLVSLQFPQDICLAVLPLVILASQ